METLIQTGLFIASPRCETLVRAASRYQSCNLVLTKAVALDYEERIAALAQRLSANRLLVPLMPGSPARMQEQAERLTLAGDNMYVQIPAVVGGQSRITLIHRLLDEGVALAVTNLADRETVCRILDGLTNDTPLILMVDGRATYYDRLITVTLAHVFPQVQVVFATPDAVALFGAQQLGADGCLIDDHTIDQVDRFSQGISCCLADHQVQFAD